ncbi:hypothetical protein H0H92_002475 [Tricholoma furcatifolium]|nr:hypothetical protein H0H92_002475 [Tricholoma furcatifolium]
MPADRSKDSKRPKNAPMFYKMNNSTINGGNYQSVGGNVNTYNGSIHNERTRTSHNQSVGGNANTYHGGVHDERTRTYRNSHRYIRPNEQSRNTRAHNARDSDNVTNERYENRRAYSTRDSDNNFSPSRHVAVHANDAREFRAYAAELRRQSRNKNRDDFGREGGSGEYSHFHSCNNF